MNEASHLNVSKFITDLENQNLHLAHKFATAQEKIEEMRQKLARNGKASTARSARSEHGDASIGRSSRQGHPR